MPRPKCDSEIPITLEYFDKLSHTDLYGQDLANACQMPVLIDRGNAEAKLWQ